MGYLVKKRKICPKFFIGQIYSIFDLIYVKGVEKNIRRLKLIT
jgi:hypothetical protein